MQYRGNLDNAGEAFAATAHYQKINWSNIKIPETWPDVVDTTLHRVFSWAMLSQEYYDNITQDFFMCNAVWSLSSDIAQGFYLRNIVLRVLRQYWFFLVQCCLEPQGQHCIGLLPVLCCPRAHSHLFAVKWIIWSAWPNIDPQSTNNFAQENNLQFS